MGQTTVNVRVDEDVKKRVEAFCGSVGMNISTAVNLFFKAVLIQGKIPFEIAGPEDPFFTNPVNRARLLSAIEDYRAERGGIVTKTLAELEAMEDD